MSTLSINYSCKKDNHFNNKTDREDGSLYFNVIGVKEAEYANHLIANTLNTKKLDSHSIQKKIFQSIPTRFDQHVNISATVLQSDIIDDNPQNLQFVNLTNTSHSESKLGKPTKIAAASKMLEGKKYRILIFDQTGNKFITKLDATVGGTTPKWRNAKTNTTYKWIAYTYNSETLPDFPENPTAQDFNITLTQNNGENNKPLFWDEGQITTSKTPHTDNNSNILFDAKHAVYQLKISSRAMHDQIINFKGKIEGLPIYGGVFDLKTGNYKSKSSTPTTHVNLESADFYSSSNDTVFNILLYTTHEGKIPGTGIHLTLDEITFKTDAFNKAGKSSLTLTKTRSGEAIKYSINSISNFNSVIGKKNMIIYDLTLPLIIIDNTFFSMYNLYYDEINNKYAFRHYNLNIYEHPDFNGINGYKQEYFNWKSRRPGANETTNIIDPCSLVYPKGLYRLPTKSELELFVHSAFSNTSNTNVTPRKYSTYSADTKSRKAFFILENTSFMPFQLFDGLEFLQLGYRESGSNNYSQRSNASSDASTTHLWSNEMYDANNAYYLSISNNGTNQDVSTEINYGPVTQGKQIRCVHTLATRYISLP